MISIGCDYHPGFQRIACLNTDTGELSEWGVSTGSNWRISTPRFVICMSALGVKFSSVFGVPRRPQQIVAPSRLTHDH